MRIDVAADLLSFDEALAWFTRRIIIDEAKRHDIHGRARARSWWIANCAQASVVQSVFDDVDRALKNGQGFQLWRKQAKAKLDAAWSLRGKASAFRVETIWRNASQQALGRGRYEQMAAPAIKKMRPYWMFDAVMDSRVSDVCSALNGTILPADDPWWDTHTCPLHHRCRSGIRSLRRSVAEKRGISDGPPTDEKGQPLKAQDGFGYAPDKLPEPGAGHEAQSLDPELAGAMNWRAKHLPPEIPEIPKGKPEHTAEHWLETYAHLGDSASTVAAARAAQERGFDLPIDEALALLDEHGIALARTLRAAAEGTGAKTMRDLLAKDEFLASSLGPTAALAGHVARRPKVKVEEPEVEYPQRNAAPLRKRVAEMRDQLNALVDGDEHSLKAAHIVYQKDRRASQDNGKIFAHRSSEGRTYLHEWGHLLEERDPLRLAKSVAFLEARTKGEVAQKLSRLTGSKKYKWWEIAKKDKFLAAYVGKIYKHNDGKFYATEVLSMGIERLLSAPVTFWHDDPEHFLFCLGQLLGD